MKKEKQLLELIQAIKPGDPIAANASRKRWNSIAKPLGSLGLLEEAVVKTAALTGSEELSFRKKELLVFCADNGVVSRGVTQQGSNVTAAVALALAEGRSSVSPMAGVAGCTVIPIDMGIRDFPGSPGIRNYRVRNGTEDISRGPAMTREECLEAILAGADVVREEAKKGTDLFAAGEMSIGNTTTATAVTACLLDIPPEMITGRGAGLSTAGLARKKQAIREALRINAPDREDAIEVLTKVGGLDIAAMCGAFLGAAKMRVPILVDGLISSTAALCAARLCLNVKAALLASHISAEPAGKLIMDALELKPLIQAEMRLGEGSGAVAAMPLLEMALAVYNSNQTFDKLGIEPYRKLD